MRAQPLLAIPIWRRSDNLKFTKHLPAVVCSSALFLAFTAPAAYAQKPTPPSSEELAAITERGILLNEYDQAAWHASDAVQTANPKTIDGQRWIAKTANGLSSLANSMPKKLPLKSTTKRSNKPSLRNLPFTK